MTALPATPAASDLTTVDARRRAVRDLALEVGATAEAAGLTGPSVAGLAAAGAAPVSMDRVRAYAGRVATIARAAGRPAVERAAVHLEVAAGAAESRRDTAAARVAQACRVARAALAGGDGAVSNGEGIGAAEGLSRALRAHAFEGLAVAGVR